MGCHDNPINQSSDNITLSILLNPRFNQISQKVMNSHSFALFM
jgi:hypothetical protein